MEMLNRTTSRQFIEPRRQARKERRLLYYSEPWCLCVFARDKVFSDLLFIPKYQISLASFSLGPTANYRLVSADP
ncbi:MAG: hypothetical protein U1E51_09515, partial [Candidatus Binatia bacterium]|nr:hypothetical protein [Candidatus Binatia bacterium]